MTKTKITVAEFARLLPKACSRETSFDPEHWSEDNPFYGHCAVVSVLAHQYFGGWVLKEKVQVPRSPKLISHYWNGLPNGRWVDFTEEQFRKGIVARTARRNVTNSLVHIRIKKSKRYKKLAYRFRKLLKTTAAL